MTRGDRKITEGERIALQASLWFFWNMCSKERVRLNGEVAGMVIEAYNAVKQESDPPLAYDNATHRQRSNLIAPAPVMIEQRH